MLHIPEIETHSLKNILRSRGIRQVEAARMLGVSVSTLSHYLNGYRPIPAEVQEQIKSIQKSLEEGELSDESS